MAIIDLSVVQISVMGVSNGQAVNNVFHYIPGTLNPAFGSSMTDCLNAFRAGWRASVLPAVCDDYSVFEYRGVEIRGSEAFPTNPSKFRPKLGEFAVVPGQGALDTGADTGEPLPTYAAVSIAKLTNLAGRSNRGSCRIGVIPKSRTNPANGNQLLLASLLAFQPAADFVKTVLNTAVPGDTLNPCIFSRTKLLSGVQPKIDTLGSRVAIVQTATSTFLGSQVSRKQRLRGGV